MNTAGATATTPQRKMFALTIALWAAQLVLAVMFGMGGFMKMTAPVDTLVQTVPWSADMPVALVRFIGASELAGALGLLLPALTRIKPALTPLAALGLATIMLLAALFHITRGELAALPWNIGLGALALFVAWGRTRRAPIPPR
jgi:putative oxidoreductase